MIRRRRNPHEHDPDKPPQEHSFRCSIHALNFPTPGQCAVEGCEERLEGIQNQPPTPDLAYHVALISGEPLPYEEKAEGWRVEQLVRAGAPIEVAERVAEDRSIDLHHAVQMFMSTTPELAERILL